MSWAVVWSKPNREKVAVLNLERQGFEVYWPRYQKMGRVRSLFPRYLFVYVAGMWRSLRGTIGVAGIVMDGDQPARVRNEIVSDLRARERNGLVELGPRYGLGQKLTIVGEGIFSGYSGIYDGQSSEERIMLLLGLLGRSVRVSVHSSEVTE